MMKSKKVHGVVSIVFVLALFLVTMAGASDIGDTLKNTCSRCHSTKRICLNVGVKDASAWKSTVTRMVGKGAQLPTDQIGAAADYLSGLKPGTGSVCQ